MATPPNELTASTARAPRPMPGRLWSAASWRIAPMSRPEKVKASAERSSDLKSRPTMRGSTRMPRALHRPLFLPRACCSTLLCYATRRGRFRLAVPAEQPGHTNGGTGKSPLGTRRWFPVCSASQTGAPGGHVLVLEVDGHYADLGVAFNERHATDLSPEPPARFLPYNLGMKLLRRWWQSVRPAWLRDERAAFGLIQAFITLTVAWVFVHIQIGDVRPDLTATVREPFFSGLMLLWLIASACAMVGMFFDKWWAYFLEVLVIGSFVLVAVNTPSDPRTTPQPLLPFEAFFSGIKTVLALVIYVAINCVLIARGMRRRRETRAAIPSHHP